MSGHTLHQAAKLRIKPLSTKVVLMALAEACDANRRLSSPGMVTVQEWTDLGTSQVYDATTALINMGYLVRYSAGRRGRNAEFLVLPGGCCADHGPLSGYEHHVITPSGSVTPPDPASRTVPAESDKLADSSTPEPNLEPSRGPVAAGGYADQLASGLPPVSLRQLPDPSFISQGTTPLSPHDGGVDDGQNHSTPPPPHACVGGAWDEALDPMTADAVDDRHTEEPGSPTGPESLEGSYNRRGCRRHPRRARRGCVACTTGVEDELDATPIPPPLSRELLAVPRLSVPLEQHSAAVRAAIAAARAKTARERGEQEARDVEAARRRAVMERRAKTEQTPPVPGLSGPELGEHPPEAPGATPNGSGTLTGPLRAAP